MLEGANSVSNTQAAVSPAAVNAIENDAARARAEWGDWSGAVAPPPGAAQVLASAPAANSTPGIADVRTSAIIASDVYNDTAQPPAGYRVATEADLRQLGLTPQMLEQPDSSFRARVYVTGEGADTSYTVGFRGTQSREDWVNNARQGLGWPSGHYEKAQAIGEAVARSGVENVTLTGHSLGGGLASAAAIVSGRDAHSFNAAGLADATIDRATAAGQAVGVDAPGQVDAYYVRGEILSLIQDGGDRVIGGLLGGVLGGLAADAPEAYGNRHELDAVKPEGSRFWEHNGLVERHGMDWVIRGLDRAAAD